MRAAEQVLDKVALVAAIAGPTASGKSALAMALVERYAQQGQTVEIISVDSALVYRDMDLGTAKPTARELAACPHHLINVIDARESYSAARFVAEVQALLPQIRARGALPLLVGGTMLYFKALAEGLSSMPGADLVVRKRIEERAATLGWPALHAELALVDAATAARLAPNDSQRIGRALEVWQSSGKALSTFHEANAGQSPPQPLALIGLLPRSRAWLHERIAMRFDAMLAAGLVQEVAALRARRDLHAGLPSMRCVGYRQVWEALDQASPDAGCPRDELDAVALSTLRERGIAATRQLAKRQLTWLRSMAVGHPLEPDVLEPEGLCESAFAWLKAQPVG